MSDEAMQATLAGYGKPYQEKALQAILEDPQHAEQVADVFKPEYFELGYLQQVARLFFEHHRTFKTFPSPELVEIMAGREVDDEIQLQQIRFYLKEVKAHPLNGDATYIRDSSLDFARRQVLKEAMIRAIDRIEESDFDSVSTIIRDALVRGATRDEGHEYAAGVDKRASQAEAPRISTGWPVLDGIFKGGWKRQILVTCIAPTGAGKSHFLVNCGAALVQNGNNGVHITCELSEEDTGVRYDAYYAGVEIDEVTTKKEEVRKAIAEKAKGQLFIKGFPTKTATVQGIRAYIQRLKTTRNFTPDFVVVDYADLLRSSRHLEQKRFELEGVYEELRALAQELNVVVFTADQTNRSGLDMEVVTIGQIGEAYAKATVCDVILTMSRRMEDKQQNTGRLFVAKSRLGKDGIVFPFLLNTAKVKISVLSHGTDPLEEFVDQNKSLTQKSADRARELILSRRNRQEHTPQVPA